MPAIGQLTKQLREALAAFEPELRSGADCAALVEELAATEKACAAARARAGARAAQCGAHRARGFVDAVDWLARTAGSSPGEARSALTTIAAVEHCPETKDALLSGELSLAQAGEIARTEALRPGVEAELLEVARHSSLGALKDQARKTRLDSVDVDALHREQHARRSFRHWRGDLGMVCFQGSLPPEVGLPFVNRLDRETDRARRTARREGGTETRAAYAADGFLRLVSGKGRGKANSADLVIACDVRAFRRGHAHDGEVCHLVGGGPIPVALARELASDAFFKAVLHDGVRIHTIAHFGRHIPPHVRTALDLGAPPDFNGIVCGEEGCGRRYGLEIDHVDPRANDGVTSYDNLLARCWPHHQEKERRIGPRSAGTACSSVGGPPK